MSQNAVNSPLTCYHCDETADAQDMICPDPAHPDRVFCCHGCQSVYQLIHNEGLEGFYQQRTVPAVTPRSLTRAELERLQQLDHPAAQSAFVAPAKAGLEASLLIGGLTCAACIWLLERHLRMIPGVQVFRVNHSTQRAHLVWSPEQVQLSQLLIAVHELGFTASPYHADDAEKQLKAESRSALIRVCVAGIGTMQTMMLAFPLYFEVVNDLTPETVQMFRWFSLVVATPVIFYSAKPFFSNAVRDLRTRHLTMDVPVAIAIGLAFLASVWITLTGGEEVYFESVCMFTFFLALGRYIETRARYRSGLTGSALGSYQPEVASRLNPDGTTEVVATHELQPGDRVRIRPGETLSVDGRIAEGRSTLNEAALTGEYLPTSYGPGSEVHAGSINGENPLDIEVLRTGSQTRLSGILRVLDRVQSEKPRVARMADRIAGVFVSRVLVLAPVVWLGWWLYGADNAFDITLSVLVVTCPCALSLATPTALTSATLKLRKLGFLPTRGHTLESLGSIDTVVFDKTGTLTEGRLNLIETRTFAGISQEEAESLAAGLEQSSEHPIARVFEPFRPASVSGIENHLGKGLTGQLDPHTPVAIGHRDFITEFTGQPLPEQPGDRGIDLWLARGKQIIACFLIDDRIRKGAPEAVASLHNMGIRTLILSGDRSGHVARVARELGIDEAVSGASPEDKLSRLQELIGEGRSVMMVGDGLNDLPSMAGASVSVAMGSATDLTQLKADAVLLSGQLSQLTEAVRASRETRRVIHQNLIWAISYNLLALPAAAAGLVPPWLAAIGMSSSSLIVVLNALRLGRDRQDKKQASTPMEPEPAIAGQ